MGVDIVDYALSKKNAIKYGSIGIKSIEGIAGTSKIRFTLVNDVYFDWDLSETDAMFSSVYDTDNNGVVDNSEKLKDNLTTLSHDGSYYLDRTNHTGNDNASTVLINKALLDENFKTFTGTTMQDVVDFIDSFSTFTNGVLYIGEQNVNNTWKLAKTDKLLSFYRYDDTEDEYTFVTSIGSSVTSDKFIFSEWQGRILATKKDGTKRTVIKTSADDDGVVIGNKFGRNVMVNDGEFWTFQPMGINQVITVNPCTEEEGIAGAQTISEWQSTFQSSVVAFYAGVIDLDLIEVPDNTQVRIWVTSEDGGNIIVENCSRLELAWGRGQTVYSGKNTVVVSEPFPVDMTTKFIVNMKFTNPVKAKGTIMSYEGSTTQFFPMFKFSRELSLLGNITTEEWVKDNTIKSDSMTLDSSETYASSKAVASLSKIVSAISGGASPLMPISVEEFKLLQEGINGQHYIFTNDGVVHGKTISKRDHCYIVNDFDYKDSTPAIYIQETDYVTMGSEEVSENGVFITNIETGNTSNNTYSIMNDYPNEATVKSVVTDDSQWKVTVTWDRNASSWTGGIPKVNGIEVIGITYLGGGTFSGYAIVTSSDITDTFTATLGESSYNVPIVQEEKPIISNFIGASYPEGQTECKENDIIIFACTSSRPVKYVYVYDFELSKYKKITYPDERTSCMIPIDCANRGFTTPINQRIKFYVETVSGSKSSDYICDSSAGMLLNNVIPSMTFTSKTYPAEQIGLKNTEDCRVYYTCSNTDSISCELLNGELAWITLPTLTGCYVNRIGSNAYNVSTPNMKYTLTKTSNGAKAIVEDTIWTCNVTQVCTTADSYIPIQWESDGTSTTHLFDKICKLSAITSSPTRIKIVNASELINVYGQSFTFKLQSQSEYANPQTWASRSTVYTSDVFASRGISDLTLVTPLKYMCYGFAHAAYTLTYPSVESAQMPVNVTDETKLVISNAYINTPIPFEIMKTKVSLASLPTSTADCWAYDSSTNTIKLSPAVAQFGYSATANISFEIRENI